MKKQTSRWLLIALVVTVIAVAIRVISGGSGRSGLVVFENMEPSRLYHATLEVERAVQVSVEARGSYEKEGLLATYGWIVRHEDASVVWQMTPANSVHERGELAKASGQITLSKGHYSVYFTTYGDPMQPVGKQSWWNTLFGSQKRAWQAETNRWYMTVDVVNAQEKNVVRMMPENPRFPADPTIAWQFVGDRFEQQNAYLFRVTAPASIQISAIGDFPGNPADYVQIESLLEHEAVWKMTQENTQPAGGAIRNRKYEGEVALQPGLYRITYIEDFSHGYTSWEANPPLIPERWGVQMRIFPDQQAHVQELDPWTQPRVAGIVQVGDDADLSQIFTLDQDATVYLFMMGEMYNNECFDCGWLENEQTNERVWEINTADAKEAGGNNKNRYQDAYIKLPAGTYSLHFKSDDSHSYNHWNTDPPTNPERWGISIYLLSDGVTFKTEEAKGKGGVGAVVEELLGDVVDGVRDLGESLIARRGGMEFRKNEEELVNLTQVGRNQHERHTIALRQPVNELRVIAMGEMDGEWMDWGWIENRQGKVVWRMNADNTRVLDPEDSGSVRLYNDVISLPAGTYTVHYQTDEGFGAENLTGRLERYAPYWGIRMALVSR